MVSEERSHIPSAIAVVGAAGGQKSEKVKRSLQQKGG